jgi:hypothetical protein
MPALSTSIPSLSPSEALKRLQSAVEDAAKAVEHEQHKRELLNQPGPAYDQGQLDATQRVLNLIAIRLDQTPRGSAAQTELRRLREAILDRL